MIVKCKKCGNNTRISQDWRKHGLHTREGGYLEPSNCFCAGEIDCGDCGNCRTHCECYCKKCQKGQSPESR